MTAKNSPELADPDHVPPANPIAVFGHKNPDTDAIVGAIAASDWLNQISIPATAYRLGDINKETRYLLALAGVEPPLLLPALPANSCVALVDHNESQQSVTNLAELQVVYTIDHHKLGDLSTAEPAFLHFRPVGSSCTILYGLLQQDKCTISPQLATLMAGAVVSDTLNLTSPTTTEADRVALSNLLTLASISDCNTFANQLFIAKSDVSDLTAEQLVTSDYKQFSFLSGNPKHATPEQWGIAVVETVHPQQIFERLSDIQRASETIRLRDNLAYLLVIVVDILAQQSWALGGSAAQNAIIMTAFAVDKADKTAAEKDLLEKGVINLGNRVSRKKQFVPTLAAFYKA